MFLSPNELTVQKWGGRGRGCAPPPQKKKSGGTEAPFEHFSKAIRA